jgi:5-methylcytosine-specific restriction endonuclease McrA
MPSLPAHVCSGCHQVVEGKCPTCRQRQQQKRTPRPWRKWYATERWRRERDEFLAEPANWWCYNPLGLHPERHRVRAETVDHYRPHKGDAALFWDHHNWRACCLRCNSAKAAREEGGFGRQVKA